MVARSCASGGWLELGGYAVDHQVILGRDIGVTGTPLSPFAAAVTAALM